MQNIKELLGDLLTALQAIHSPLVDQLQQGLTHQNIEDKIKPLGINFLEDLYDLYSWKNGLLKDTEKSWKLGERYLLNLGFFRSLDEAIYFYQKCANKIWEEKFFPIFESGGGDYYLIDLKGQPEKANMIYFLSPSNPDFQGTISIYDSLQLMIQSITQCYIRKAYYYDDSTFLQIKDDLEREIAVQLNPNSMYWKLFDQ